jgi:hypothetical protein
MRLYKYIHYAKERGEGEREEKMSMNKREKFANGSTQSKHQRNLQCEIMQEDNKSDVREP